MLYKNIEDLIGHTPLVALERFSKAQGLSSVLYAKLEGYNPSGSMKDRVALALIKDAEASGRLKPGGTIYEATSGNTGIGLAAVGKARGYRVVLVMPETMSVERRKLMAIYGAEFVLTPGAEGMKGAIARAERLVQETENSILAGQFEQEANPEMHYKTTGPEIWEDTQGQIDTLIAGVGTGGSISGAGRFLKEKGKVRVYAVEPKASPVLSGGQSGPHKIQGIGAGFVPKTLDQNIYDEIIQVDDQDAFAMVRSLAETEGIFAGVSSGAALWAACQAARAGQKHIVAILPDQGARYLSMDALFDGSDN